MASVVDNSSAKPFKHRRFMITLIKGVNSRGPEHAPFLLVPLELFKFLLSKNIHKRF